MNPTTTIVTSATAVTIIVADAVTTVETPVEIVVPPNLNHPIFPPTPNRLTASYTWGMPPNFTNGGSFILHQALAAPSAVGNSAFPWGIPIFQSPQMVDAGNHENLQGQV